MRLIAGQVTLRTYGHAVLSHTSHVMMIDDSTTKNTRLLDIFIPKTEHLDLIFCPMIPTGNVIDIGSL